MAYPLTSPGVDISVIDESFYATAGQGTTPLIIIGTHEYKIAPNGVDIAQGTLPENANKLYLITSQRELIRTFGNPVFYQNQGTSRHGYELNEYGLHAAYSYLGMSSKAFVIRGAIDYSQLFPRKSEPRGEALPGTYWLDTSTSKWGIHQGLNSTTPGSAWNPQTPLVVDKASDVEHRVLGSVAFDSATDVAIATNGFITLNGTVVNFAGNDSLQTVVAKINAASITNVSARVLQLSEKAYLLITNTTEGAQVVIGNTSQVVLDGLGLNAPLNASFGPKSTIGADGNYAIVLAESNQNEVYQKIRAGGIDTLIDPLASSFWFVVGSDEWKAATPTRANGSNLGNTTIVTGVNNQTLILNAVNDPLAEVTVTFGTGLTVADIAAAINAELAAQSVDPNKVATTSQLKAIASNGQLVIVNKIGGDFITDSDSVAALALGIQTTFGKRLVYSPHYSIPYRTDDLGTKRVVAGDVWINTTQYNNGSQWVVKYFNGNTGLWNTLAAPLLPNDIAANALYGASKSIGAVYVQYNILGTTNNPVASQEIRRWNGTIWESLVYNYGTTEPTTDAEEGMYWFNDDLRVDIMINDGDQWVGYKNYLGNQATSANGPILAGSAPQYQQNGNPLANNDIWINTSDLENYPKMYRYDAINQAWKQINNTDQTTPNGILFADARATSNGRRLGPTDIGSMLVSNYLDPDAPDPRVYPEGTLLFNTRYSTYNVKEWRPNYFAGEYQSTNFTLAQYNVGYSSFPALVDVGRWVTVSGNREDGSPNMGRKAQRAMIVRSLTSTISSNDDIRAESIYFNLMATPGYPELIDEMVTLNTDKKEVAFIVGDTPIRLQPDATSLQKYANAELSGASTNGEDGLITFNPNVGVYYPWGLGSNIDGFEVMIPPSTMALRTIAYSDSISYPWFAPAGTIRGLVTNAVNVGYLTKEGEFQSVLLNEGQRDVLYSNKINSIAYVPNRGLMLYGQRTRNANDSALDRINVARLVNYMRYNLDDLSKNYLFQPHTFHTRDSIRIAFERYLGSLVNLDALYDFIVVCDETNNTPDRIDRNELWVDIAIKPVKAIEFIYVPIRIVNTGDDLAELYATATTL